MAAQFGTASLDGGLPVDATLDVDIPQEIVADNLKVFASIEQGHQLQTDADALQPPHNLEFDGDLILAGKKKFQVAEGVTFIVAGPMKPELKALQKKHDAWLKEQRKKKKKKDGAAALAAYVDKSVPNLSSLVEGTGEGEE